MTLTAISASLLISAAASMSLRHRPAKADFTFQNFCFSRNKMSEPTIEGIQPLKNTQEEKAKKSEEGEKEMIEDTKGKLNYN